MKLLERILPGEESGFKRKITPHNKKAVAKLTSQPALLNIIAQGDSAVTNIEKSSIFLESDLSFTLKRRGESLPTPITIAIPAKIDGRRTLKTERSKNFIKNETK